MAQLPHILSPPALRIAVVKDGAGVVSSSRNGHGRPARAEVNRCGGRYCCVRVSCMLCSAVAQLSVVIPSPTLQVAVVKDGAGVAYASRNRNGCSARAEVNRCGRRCCCVRRRCMSCSTIAQLSLVVSPPTLQVAVVKDSAGVVSSSRNGHGRSARAEVNRCGGRCCCVRVSCMLCSAVAQLSVVIPSPTCLLYTSPSPRD